MAVQVLEPLSIKLIGDVDGYVKALRVAEEVTAGFHKAVKEALGAAAPLGPAVQQAMMLASAAEAAVAKTSKAKAAGKKGGKGSDAIDQLEKEIKEVENKAKQGEKAAEKFEDGLKKGRVKKRKSEVLKEEEPMDAAVKLWMKGQQDGEKAASQFEENQKKNRVKRRKQIAEDEQSQREQLTNLYIKNYKMTTQKANEEVAKLEAQDVPGRLEQTKKHVRDLERGKQETQRKAAQKTEELEEKRRKLQRIYERGGMTGPESRARVGQLKDEDVGDTLRMELDQRKKLAKLNMKTGMTREGALLSAKTTHTDVLDRDVEKQEEYYAKIKRRDSKNIRDQETRKKAQQKEFEDRAELEKLAGHGPRTASEREMASKTAEGRDLIRRTDRAKKLLEDTGAKPEDISKEVKRQKKEIDNQQRMREQAAKVEETQNLEKVDARKILQKKLEKQALEEQQKLAPAIAPPTKPKYAPPIPPPPIPPRYELGADSTDAERRARAALISMGKVTGGAPPLPVTAKSTPPAPPVPPVPPTPPTPPVLAAHKKAAIGAKIGKMSDDEVKAELAAHDEVNKRKSKKSLQRRADELDEDKKEADRRQTLLKQTLNRQALLEKATAEKGERQQLLDKEMKQRRQNLLGAAQEKQKAEKANRQRLLDAKTKELQQDKQLAIKNANNLANKDKKARFKAEDDAQRAKKKAQERGDSINARDRQRRADKEMKDWEAQRPRGWSQTEAGIQALGGSAAAFGAPIALALKKSIDDFAEFDQAIIESQAIMKLHGDQDQRMRDTALQLSGQTKFAAEEVAGAYYHLASSGLDAEQSIQAVGTVTRFAQAGVLKMEEATSLLTNTQNALNLKMADPVKNMQQMTRVADVFNKANIMADATTKQFAEAMTSDAAPTLRAYNKSLEEGTAVLAVYADQGYKGKVAGSHLGRALRFLNQKAITNKSEFKRLGVEVFDSSGKMKNMADIVESLENAMRGMSDESKAKILKMLGFEARMQKALLPLIGKSGKIRTYEQAFKGAGGTTAEVAEKQMLSFTNQMKRMWNQIKVVSIGIGELLAPAMLFLTDVVKVAWYAWSQLPGTFKSIIVFTLVGIVVMTGLTAAIIGAGLAANVLFGGVGIGLGLLVTGITGIIALIGGFAGAVIGLGLGMTGGMIAARKQLAKFWEWLKPLREAFTSLFTTLADLWKAGLGMMYASLQKLFGAFMTSSGAASIQWKDVLDTMVAGVYFVEFSIINLEQVWEAFLAGAKYGAAKLGNDFLHLFSYIVENWGLLWLDARNNLVAFMLNVKYNFVGVWERVLSWLKYNWESLIINMMFMATKLANNIGNIWAHWDDIRTGKKKITDLIDMESLLEELPRSFKALDLGGIVQRDFTTGFTRNTKEFSADRVIGETENKLRMEFERLGGNAGEDFKKFLARKLSAKGKKDPLDEAAEAKGEKVGADITKGMGKEMEKLDAVLFRSAEAITRWQNYMDRIRDPKRFPDEKGDRPGNVKAHDVRDAEGAKDMEKQNELLKRIADNTNEQLKRPPLNVENADL